jgi:Cof subfamily protein (haloacid dehalogenase superfamily)
MSDSIRLVAIDADDTLLDSDLKVSIQVKEAIIKAQKAGVYVTVATGRMLNAIVPIAEALGITVPLIAYNGAWIGDVQGNTMLHDPLPDEVLLPLANLAHELDLCLNMYIDHQLYVDSAHDEPVEYYKNLAQCKAKRVDLVEYLKYHPQTMSTKALLIIEKPDDKLYDYLQDTFPGLKLTRSKKRFIEVMADGVSKGAALQSLSQHLGVGRHSVMAIGDSFNDLEMIEYAGLGVAVANGVKALREAADKVVPSNDEGGVAVAINQYVLGNMEKKIS